MLRTVAALLLALSCATPAMARPLVELSVIDRESGHWLPQAHHRGQHWIAGTPGHRYAVRLTNASSERVLVVLSVDGINAVTGDVADPSQGGYVLAPWQSTEIAGWRKSYDDIAQFVFTHLADSYAARTGRPDNVGVIGIAVFQEARAPSRAYSQAPVAPPAPIAGRTRGHAGTAANAPQRDSAQVAAESHAGKPPAQRVGTGHGEREWSPVAQTTFRRASSRPAQLTQLRYDAHATLVARGILPREFRHPRPQAFPHGFVADPPRH